MNDQVLQSLRAPVERAVRPLRASIRFKRHAREELLGHLVEVFEQELAATGDEQVALARAQSRFGEPAELTAELAGSVSKFDPVQRFFELSATQPMTLRSAIHRSLMMSVQMLVFEALPIALVAPIMLTFRSATQVGYATATLVLAATTGAVFMPILMLCAYLLRRSFFEPARTNSETAVTRRTGFQRFTRGAAVIVASAMFAPAIGAVSFALLSRDIATVVVQAPMLMAIAVATPICAALIGYAEQTEIDRDRVWTQLEIAN